VIVSLSYRRAEKQKTIGSWQIGKNSWQLTIGKKRKQLAKVGNATNRGYSHRKS